MKTNNKFKTVTADDFDDFKKNLFDNTEQGDYDDPNDSLETPMLAIDLDEVNQESTNMASLIVERLSGYYFDEKYIKDHPYIPTKIMTEMENIRRLLKMLTVNERAQDALISNITMNAGKGTLYAALTSLQNATLAIQKQLNDLTEGIEAIFQRMQEDAEKNYSEKEKEKSDSGMMVVRGSREFIKELSERLYRRKNAKALENEQSDIEEEKPKTDIEIDEEEIAKII